MLAGGYSWRLFFYVVLAFAAALLVAAFFLVEETNFKRPEQSTIQSSDIADEKLQTSAHTESITPAVIPARKTYISTLRPWSPIDPDARFFVTMLRSFTYFCVPAVLWVITTFGMI
jgi:ABC-type spermidine/putrescine transport system permease subunit II